MTIVPEPVWRLESLLGEGPAWFPHEAVLRFVDIKRGLLHRFDPASQTGDTLAVGGKPSFVVPAMDGGLLVGSEHGVFRLKDGRLSNCVAVISQPEGNRTNDATVDSRGRLWFGTMDDGEQHATGALWCLDRGNLSCAGGQAVVTNGPAVNSEGSLLYHVDSGSRTIWRFAIGEQPGVARGEVFLQLGEEAGHPDGVVVDSEDCLWVALWDGWGVRRYAPDGTFLAQVALPCARVTKLAFGGPDLSTAFVTTARVGLDAAALAEQPLAGSLFAFDAPAPGRVLPSVVIG
jgi:sugar lactone lactonase YvrE